MAKVSHLVCDVTGIADETVTSVKLPFPMASENGAPGEYRVVTLSLDIAAKALDDILAKVGKDIKPLFTEATTATVKGEAKPKTENGDDDATPEFGSSEHMRQYARSIGMTVGDRGALPKTVKDAFSKAVANGDIVKPDENDEEDAATEEN